MTGREVVHVDAHPAEVVQALQDVLHERGIKLYAVVDHGHDMRDAGAAGFTAWTLVFGNPAAGAQLLAHDLDAAVDIPLRLAVVAEDHEKSRIVLRDMRTLLGDRHGELADAFTGVLRALANEARERVGS